MICSFMLERTITYKKFVKQFQILEKNNSKIQILKLLKDQKILKNQMTKQKFTAQKLLKQNNIYIYIYKYIYN